METIETSSNSEIPPKGSTAPASLQDRLAATFGIQAEDRETTIRSMLNRSGREQAGYWLQIVLAMGIASLGLVLGSTAVVIGAMLISPLMGPIVEFGMGLAIGSPLLVLRSASRIAMSILLVVVLAALLTIALPFKEVTSEIAARTSPTALDLLIAIFCAIAAAYTTVLPSSETTGTAAGTAIGIALVPPLCVIGYGIGTASRSIAGGAALLFTANFCAILLFAVLCFLLLGFSSVNVAVLERTELERHQRGTARRIVNALQFLFGMKHGPLLRVLMPLILVGSIYIPLRDALMHVTWQVRVRTAIERMLRTLPQDTVRSNLSVEQNAVSLNLVTLGRTDDAQALERDLKAQIAAISGVVPAVHVVAVPDAAALASAAKPTTTTVEVVRKVPDPKLLRQQLADAIGKLWPKEAGTLLRWRIELPEDGSVLLDVVHFGPKLGSAGAALLGVGLSQSIDMKIVVQDTAISPDPQIADPQDGAKWLPTALLALEQLGAASPLWACIEVPKAEKKKKPSTSELNMMTAALQSVAASRQDRVQVEEGRQWRIELSPRPCAKAKPEAPSLPASSKKTDK